MRNSLLNIFIGDIYNSYFKNLGFIRSGTLETKSEKRITLYSEKFSRDIGDNLSDVVNFVYYKDSGVLKFEFSQGFFVPEVYTRSFDKNSVTFDKNDPNHSVIIFIQTQSAFQQDYPYSIDSSNFEGIKEDIVNITENQVLPAFEKIRNRQDIIEYLEKVGKQDRSLAYIYGANGDIDKAEKYFNKKLNERVSNFLNGDIYAKNGIPALVQEMISLGMQIDKDAMDKFVPECKKFLESRSLSMNRIKKIDEPLYDCLTREY